MGDYETAGDALRLLLDGNQRNGRGLPALGVRRFWWYQAEKIKWNWDTSGRKRDWTNSFAGYVEGGRQALQDRRGKWRPWGVTDDNESVLRMYERLGIV